MIGAYHPWFHEELMRRIEARRAERAGALAAGACTDWADYRYNIGYFAGLNEALAQADEIKREHDRG